MTGRPLVYLTPNCTPLFNKVVQPFKGRAVGQPYSTIQKNIKKFGRFKKNTFLCIVTNIKNMKKRDFITPNATFICGNYKILVLSPMYLELKRTLDYLLDKLIDCETREGKEINYALRTFVDYLAVDLELPLQVLSLPLSVLKDFDEVSKVSKDSKK